MCVCVCVSPSLLFSSPIVVVSSQGCGSNVIIYRRVLCKMSDAHSLELISITL